MSQDERPEKSYQSAFMQQKLPDFFTQYSAPTVSLCLFIVAIVMIPLGIAIIVESDAIFDVDLRYDQYHKCTAQSNQGVLYTTDGNNTFRQGCITKVPLTLDKTVASPIYIYYRVKGFHQNFRDYTKSRSDTQSAGTGVSKSDISDCKPFKSPGDYRGGNPSITVEGTSITYENMIYRPCGTIAWSMFNDSISLYKVPLASAINLSDPVLPSSAAPICLGGSFFPNGTSAYSQNHCSKTGIALKADVKTRFKIFQPSLQEWTGFGHNSSDFYLRNGFYANEAGHRVPLPHDEDYMVWTRSAPLPDFRKLYRRIDVDLVAGDYVFDIVEYFDTTSFSGEKHVVLATVGWVGGKNYVLGALFLVVGGIGALFGVAFVALWCARKTQTK